MIGKEEIGLIVVSLIGIACIFWGVRGILKSKQTLSWLITEGEVVESTISRSKTNTVNITYWYSVSGVQYCSSRVYFGSEISFSTNKERQEQMVREYKEFSKVQVYYNPEKPQESVLETGFHDELSNIIYFGIFFLFITSLLYFHWIEMLVQYFKQ